MATLGEMLEQLGLYEMLDHATEHEERILDMEIEVHQQPSYPLKGELINSRVMEDDNVIQLASGNATEYGDREAWQG